MFLAKDFQVVKLIWFTLTIWFEMADYCCCCFVFAFLIKTCERKRSLDQKTLNICYCCCCFLSSYTLVTLMINYDITDVKYILTMQSCKRKIVQLHFHTTGNVNSRCLSAINLVSIAQSFEDQIDFHKRLVKYIIYQQILQHYAQLRIQTVTNKQTNKKTYTVRKSYF